MGSPLSLNDFMRKFRAYGVNLEKRGSHLIMTKDIEGKKVMYVAVFHKNKVQHVYVRKARRRFRLLPEHNVTDKDFKKK